jgi:transglutaminase-like putative cysteine protease
VDASGRTIEGQMLGNFTFRLESEADAKRMEAVSDVMLASGVPLDKPIPKPKAAREAVLRLTGMPEGSALADRRQKFEKAAGGALLVTLRSDAVPDKRGPLTDEEKKKLAEFLSPTAFLQSEAPEIRKQAADVVGGEKDPYKAASLLCAWVYRHVDKVFTPAMSNALDTLKTRQGDCGEHAALFVALCRAAGIPAREVAGLGYTAVGGQGLLGGHAWAEVYVGGSWVAMDPTFGEELADALHLKIAEGGFGGMDGLLRLAGLMGKLKAEVVSVK